jgi:hypothetical protein
MERIPTWVMMPEPASQPANRPVIRFVTAILNLASHRLRKRIRRAAEAGMAMATMVPVLMSYKNAALITAMASHHASEV